MNWYCRFVMRDCAIGISVGCPTNAGLRSRPVCALLLVVLCLCMPLRIRIAAQTLSGVVNIYAPVSGITTCSIVVPSTVGFAPGDRVLIIQMQGASVDRSNTAAFGSILGYANAGNFEFATVAAVTPTTIAFRNRIAGSYTLADGVQAIHVAVSNGGTVAGTVTCPAWNGSTGGVIVIEDSTTLSLAADIDASGAGFRGGVAVDMNLTCGAVVNTDYFYPDGDLAGAYKGEGVARAQAASARGRGALANAGGGGNNHNGGGGGGSNGGVGGTGGSEWDNCSNSNPLTRGIPGYALGYASGSRAFMGGGGGAGHANNGSGTAGGAGGGIVIVRAASVAGNGHAIRANGANVVMSNPPGADGCGGGGGGGAVLLDVAAYLGSISVEARGGAGGSTWWDAGLIGPGGGGGGGAVIFSGAVPPGAVVSGGANGIHTPNGNPWGATPGSNGIVQNGLAIVEGTLPAAAVNISPAGPLRICLGETVRLISPSGFQAYEWAPEGGNGPVAVVTPAVSGTYSVTVRTADGCVSVATIDITVIPGPVVRAGSDVSVCAGTGRIIGQIASGGVPPYTYAWSPSTGLNSATIPQPLASPLATTQYVVTVLDAQGGCVARDTVMVTVNHPPRLGQLRDTTICFGDSVVIGTAAFGGKGPYRYAWVPATGLTNPGRATTMARPELSTEYVLTATDANGCTAVDTVHITVRAPLVAAAGPDTVLCVGASVRLEASGGRSYRWQPSQGLSCTTCPDPVARLSRTTLYTVTIADTAGCSRVDSVLVAVASVKLGAVDTVVARTGTIDFGLLDGCAISAERDVVLRNYGADPLVVDSATFNAAGFAVTSPRLPFRIAAGDSVTVRLQFLPLAQGVSVARMQLHGSPCDAGLVLTLQGQKARTSVAVQPTAIAFPDAYRCGNLPMDTVVMVANVGADTLVLQGALLATPFVLVAPGLPVSVPPGDSVSLRIRYSPVTEGDATAMLRCVYRAGACFDTLRLPLTGRYLVPSLLTVGVVDFGELSGCQAERDTTIVLRNTSQALVVLRSVQVPAGFVCRSPLPIVIAAGDSAVVALRFAPQANGTVVGRMTAVYEPCADTVLVGLRGVMSGPAFALPDTLDIGDVVICPDTADTVRLVISNNSGGGADATVAALTTTGPFGTSLTVGEVLPGQATRAYDVTFKPTTTGVAIGSVSITFAPCGVTRTVVLRGVGQLAVMAGDTVVDFGGVEVGTTAAAAAMFRNTGTTDLMVERIDVPPPFAVTGTQPPLPAVVRVGDSLRVDMRYAADSGVAISVMRLAVSTCAGLQDVIVQGHGITGAAWAAVSMPVIEAAPGELVVISVRLDSSRNLAVAGARAYSARLRFNKRLLLPVAGTPVGIIEGNERVIGVDGVRGDTVGEIASLRFRAMLADTEATTLRLESFAWSNAGPVATTLWEGQFRLRGLCTVGTTRLIAVGNRAVLRAARPNPATDAVAVEVVIAEAGRSRLYVADPLGRCVATVFNTELSPGVYATELNVEHLAGGVYYCVLETGGHSFVQPLHVAR